MSLILDALRKSDRQRARNAAERLRDGPVPAAAPRVHGVALLVVGLLLVLVLAGVVMRELNDSRRSASGAAPEIMENEPASAAPVRALAGELAAATVGPAQQADAEQPAPVEPRRAESRGAAEVAAPPLETLPALRIRLPEMQLDIHAWAEDPAERFVLINLQRYREGDRLQEGPLVRQIRPEDVVLEYEGTLFSLSRR